MINQVIEAIPAYFDHLTADFSRYFSDPVMIENYRNKLSYDVLKKYIRIKNNSGAHTFIVIDSSIGYEVGTILKPASWTSPTKNFSRGNVLNLDYSKVKWTGA